MFRSDRVMSLVIAAMVVGLMAVRGPDVVGQSKKDKPERRKKDKPITDKSGLIRKALVKTSDAKLLDAPGGKPLSSGGEPEPFTPFTRLYCADGIDDKGDDDEGIHKVTKGSDVYYRVGGLDNKPLGWIKSADVVRWDTRYILVPKADTKFVVYTKKKTGDDSPKTDEDLAKLDVLAEHPGAPENQRAMIPIITKPLDDRDPAYQIAFLVAKSYTANTKTVKKVLGEDLKLEIMFAVDTTISMQPMLDGTKEIVRQVALALAKHPGLEGKVRLGLVEYQDVHPKLVPARMVSKLTADMDAFQKALKPLKETNIPNGDTPEDVLAGLKMAIDDAGWDKVSSKHIVLLGDASAQINEGGVPNKRNSTGMSIESVIAHGRNKDGAEGEKLLAQITFHSVLAKGDDPSDRKRAKDHFEKVAANNNEIQGLFHLVEDPNKEADRNLAIKKVVEAINEAVDVLAKKSKSPSKLEDSFVRSPAAQAVWRIRKTLDTKANEVVYEGYGAERNEKGVQVALRQVLVTKPQLELLVVTLDFLNKRLESLVDPEDRKDVTGILKIIQEASVRTTTGQTVQDEDRLADIISELPLKTAALQVTSKQLSGFTQEQYSNWLNKLQDARKNADNLIRTSNWQVINRPKAKKEEMKFFPLSQLP